MENCFACAQLCSGAGRKAALALCLAFCMLGLGLSVNAEQGEAGIITFDVGGAGTGAYQGTSPYGVNPAGAITGEFFDASGVAPGYLRAPDGSITPFDAPGAGSVADSFHGTYPTSINPSGWISGFIVDDGGVYHGFVRAPDGKLTPFDCPAKYQGTQSGQGTVPMSNNLAGAITGYCIDTNGAFHGFLWTPSIRR